MTVTVKDGGGGTLWTGYYTFDITGHSYGNMGWVEEVASFIASSTVSTLTFTSTTHYPNGDPTAFGPVIDDVRVDPPISVLGDRDEVMCACPGGTGYNYWLTVKNVTNAPLTTLFVVSSTNGVAISPNPMTFTSPILPGHIGTAKLRITGLGAIPCAQVCFNLSLDDSGSCPVEHCVTLPCSPCDCIQIVDEYLVTTPTPNTYVYRFRFANLCRCPSLGLLLLVPTSPGATFSPDIFTFTMPTPTPCCDPNTHAAPLSPWFQTIITTATGQPPPLSFCAHVESPLNQDCCRCQNCFQIVLPPWGAPGCCEYDPCPGHPSCYRSDGVTWPAHCTALGGSFSPGVPPWGCLLLDMCCFPYPFGSLTGIGTLGGGGFSFDDVNNVLHATDLGSSGEDGIRLETVATDALHVEWADPDPFGDLPAGAYAEARAYGPLAGVPNQLLATLRGTTLDVGVGLDVDFAPVGAGSYDIAVYVGGTLVTQIPGHTGTVGVVERWPDSLELNHQGAAVVALARWSAPVSIQIAGGPTVAGDTLRLTAANPTNPFQSLTALELRAAGIPELLLTDIGGAFNGAWCDNFDEYAAGTPVAGQNQWQGWDNNPAAGALTSSDQAHSAPNSVAIVGASDLTRPFAGISSGRWVLKAWQYVPSDFVSHCDGSGNCGSYFVLLNQYHDGGPYSWTAQYHADSITNTFIRDDQPGDNVPLIKGSWVEIKTVFDLDQDWFRVFYNGTELGTQGSWTNASPGQTTPGVLNLGALDLFANQSTVVYYDDICLNPVVPKPGDLNCDGIVDFDDIGPFVLALSDPAGYANAYPDCYLLNGDCNGDGVDNFNDINPFIVILSGG
jgi:hypothetical protein